MKVMNKLNRSLRLGALPLHASLSGKVLALTVSFIMLSEVLIFVPSVANFRMTWLGERLEAAQIAVMALEATPDQMVATELENRLLNNAEVVAVVLSKDDSRRLMLADDMPPPIDAHFDLRVAGALQLIMDAFETLFVGSDRTIRVIGKPRYEAGDHIEIVLSEAPLRAAMWQYGANILGLSLVISVITGGLVFFALHLVLVRPIRRIMQNMMEFREHPENVDRVMAPSPRSDEIGAAERELAEMQTEIREALTQKSRLAALGLAVSKINHDLRNILSSIQLISDRLGSIEDPTVQRLAPRLFASIDRAIALCTDTLKYGRSEEAPPSRCRQFLRPVVDEVEGSIVVPEGVEVRFDNHVPEDLEIDSDPDQLFRIILNLTRNATEAMTPRGGGKLTISALRDGRRVCIDVTDTGPGLPDRAREHLFEPFSGSARSGGTGLGLPIASELARAHGGELSLLATGPRGTTFRVIIPDSAEITLLDTYGRGSPADAAQ